MAGDGKLMTLDYWDGLWANNNTMWHRPQGDETLRKLIETLTGGRSCIKIFFPLCGKAVDMAWLASLGHKVVGVEFSVKPIEEFFTENGLDYSTETVGVGESAMPVYRSADNSVRIYQGDFFKFSSAAEGVFDAVWDQGSLIAINRGDREKYADLMISLLSRNGGRYLLRTCEYNEEHFGGPPCNVPEEVVRHLYGKHCEIETVELNDCLEKGRKRFSEKFDHFREHTYLLQPKNNKIN